MELNYVYSESTVKPLSIEFCKKSVYLRKDITPETRTDDSGNEYTIWTYQEAWMTPEEFNEYSKELQITKALDNDDNQMIIMEALADLYDIIANMA